MQNLQMGTSSPEQLELFTTEEMGPRFALASDIAGQPLVNYLYYSRCQDPIAPNQADGGFQ
jgi:hypothetical protein